jgi:adenylate cyclase
VREPPRILVVDDNPINVDILRTRLRASGYDVVTAADGEEALAAAAEHGPDLILLDVVMPKLDGIEVCRRLKADPARPFTPIILVTARSESRDVVAALEAGGDEYLTKPVDQAALVARVRSMLRIKEQQDTIEAQRRELAGWNDTLETRVREQVEQIERLGRLRRFLSPSLAELVVSSGDEGFLRAHRREIACLFFDLRDSTPFVESAEPEEVTAVLGAFHDAMGGLVQEYGATVDHFAGDGVMVFLNDPLPCPSPAERAVRLAVAMRERMRDLLVGWRRHGYRLGFGVGVTLGYATIGRVGFEGRYDYGANGAVVILAHRLCSEAADGQILVSQRVAVAVEAVAELEPVGELTLKGFQRPVPAHNVVRLRPD